MKKKNRQRIRKSILIFSLLLFPVTLNYLSPYLIIRGGFSGIISGSFLFFIALFVFSLFLGRAYCGWLCPAGGLCEVASITNPKPFKSKFQKFFKYIVWIIWIGFVVYVFISAGGIKKINPLFLTDYGISVSSINNYIIYLPILLLLFIFSLIRKRLFCYTLCWMAPFMIIGRKISNFLHIPSLRLKKNKQKECKHCKICSKNCPMSLDVEKMVNENDMENTECILCVSCVDSCPHNIIKLSFSSYKKNK